MMAKLIPLKTYICNLGEGKEGKKDKLFKASTNDIIDIANHPIFLNSISFFVLLLLLPIHIKGAMKSNISKLYHAFISKLSIRCELMQYKNRLWLANKSKTNNPVNIDLLSFN